MINYTWNCKTVDTKPTEGDLTDVVYNVHWIVTAEKGDFTATSIGTQTIELDEDATFVDFDDLTNATLTTWVRAAMEDGQPAAIEASLAEVITEKETPTSVTMTIED